MIDILEQNRYNEILFQQAVALQEAGQLADAERLYRQVLQVYPNHVQVHHNLGLLAAQVGNHAASLPHLKLAFDAMPNQGQFVLAYATALMNNGYQLEALKIVKAARRRGLDSAQFKNAQRIIDVAIETAISNPDPLQTDWDQLFALYTEQKWESLELKARKFSEQYPQSGKVWMMLMLALEAQGKEALHAKRKAAQFAPTDMPLQFNLATDLQQRGLADEAEKLLEDAVRRYPDDAVAHSNLGVYLSRLARALQAGVALRRALELDPNQVRALCALAILLQQSGQPEQVQELMQRAIAVNTGSVEVIGMLGMTLYNFGQFEAAALQFNRVLALDPQHLDSILNLGNALTALGLRADAEKCYLRILELQPDSALAYNNLGLLYQQGGDLEHAVDCFERAIALFPNYANALSSLGGTWLQRGQAEQALACLRQVSLLTPEDARVHLDLGSALQALEQFAPAAQAYRQAIQCDPNFGFAYHNFGLMLLRLDQPEPAQQAFEQALRLDPLDPRILTTALTYLPYPISDLRYAQLDAVYARRGEFYQEVRANLCQAMGQALERAGDIVGAQAAFAAAALPG